MRSSRQARSLKEIVAERLEASKRQGDTIPKGLSVVTLRHKTSSRTGGLKEKLGTHSLIAMEAKTSFGVKRKESKTHQKPVSRPDFGSRCA